MFVDLHVHTCHSDGSDTVEQVIRHARRNRGDVIAITDHNTLAAYQDAKISEVCSAGLTVIPGVEIDVNHNGRSHHLLGLGIDLENTELAAFCAYSAQKQEEYNVALLKLLERDIPGVSQKGYDRYEIPAGRGGWKLLNYLLDIGVTHSLREGLRFYGQYQFNVNDIPFPTLAEAVQAVKKASGVPIIAHPAYDIPYNPYEADHSLFWSALESVVETGIEGVECIHPVHGFALEQELIDFCKERNLLISGGSDYHGQFYSGGKTKLGGQFVDAKTVDKLLDRLMG